MKEPHQKAIAALPAPPERDLAGALHEVSNALTVVLGWLDNARAELARAELARAELARAELARAEERGGSAALAGSELAHHQLSEASLAAIDIARTHASLGHAIARRAVGAPIVDGTELRSALTLVRDTVVGVSPISDRRGVRVEVDDDVADVLLPDATFVQQILINLLLNALAFTPKGDSIHLSLRNERGRFLFRVRDQGPGIPADQREGLFSAGPSRRPGGAGIGLAHSHALALSKGGSLALVDGSRGACFELRWPIGEAPSTTLSRTTGFKVLDGLRVAVLEDDPDVMSLLEFGLGSRGVELFPLRSRAQLDEFARRGTRVDVALVDLSPIAKDPDGALAELRRQCPDLTIFLISGTPGSHAVSKSVTGWIRKPFELGEIFQALGQVQRG